MSAAEPVCRIAANDGELLAVLQRVIHRASERAPQVVRKQLDSSRDGDERLAVCCVLRRQYGEGAREGACINDGRLVHDLFRVYVDLVADKVRQAAWRFLLGGHVAPQGVGQVADGSVLAGGGSGGSAPNPRPGGEGDR